MSEAVDEALAGKVAIVTGAGSRPGEGVGNGRATAILLARAGAHVVCADAVADWGAATAAMIVGEGGQAIAVTADVTISEECARIVAAGEAQWGRTDMLVNNVGISGPKGTAEEVDPAEWAQGLLVNVTSMMLMAKHAIPAMRRQGGGAIVNLGSVAGLSGGHPSLLYPTSKGAVVNMTRAMAVHHAKDGIRVNCVCPGMVYTPMVQAGGMTAERRAARRDRSVLKVEGSGWDVGAAVVFLCSGRSRWMTGAIVPVDAGATAVTAIPSG